ncbi:ComEC/Rec2 family competence protein [Thermosediminibacter litoriperuensis]|uniref:Beta-lactamase superfamily II metal-dependent hydrolase n=1 Tax=Thermosediminibacter litoriperuensis TaxID=291989 RepID=A0A5S5AVX7_9FIRM|nr:MBL fold metallo-hydrolase [Thermosediminibacter litoriperuensis]TYP56687.1 beta-lactamase superfamily II metal-dependent hydrolase [Thermosediminibacter litoriperuensis]
MKKAFRNKPVIILLLLAIIAAAFLPGCAVEIGLDQEGSGTSSGVLEVNFLDVGQADSIFIIFPGGSTMLVDAGNNDDAKTVINYIKKKGVKRIDAVVATHPHEDHIGAIDDVIHTFDIGKIYMPRVTTTTKTFRDLMQAVSDKKLKITTVKGGMTIPLEAGIDIRVLAPNNTRYDELNNYSAVLKITYKNNSFLLTGDAEKLSEREMLEKKYDLKADVLKVGHHGSSSSTSTEFLKSVWPRYAVISFGKDNDYGHPHRETLERLRKHNVKVYTTAGNGHVIMESDGAGIKVRTSR